MKKTLYLMCGPAGAGKSHYIREHAERGTSAWISRDKVRFSIVGEDQEYFSKEDEVFAEWCRQVANALKTPWVDEVWADATHLTAKARKKTLDLIGCYLNEDMVIGFKDIYICPVVVKPDLETCFMQNSWRKGRANVPETVIKNMYDSFEDPINDDIGYEYEEVYY